jgi:ankyrin repeat protein
MSDALPLPPRPNLEQYKKRAKDLQRSGNCALTQAQFLIAREHGFKSWTKFARHIQELTRANSPTSAFETAADAIVTGDIQALKKLLAKTPGLATQRSTREHRSTLLHYVSANGVEDFRQKTPKNIVEITNLLLDAGAELDAESDAYGGGCTTLGLVATSAHPEGAGVQIPLLQTLLDHGANLHHGEAGGNHQTIVTACLHNGQPEAAEFLANLGAHVDLEGAAALDRLPLLHSYLEASPKQKEIESAFLSACAYGSTEAAELLLDRGVDPATHNEEGQTGLHFACWGPHIEAIKLLLKRGAPVDVKENRYHAIPLDMALWTWLNKKEERDHCYEAIALLVEAGSKYDRDHWSEFRENIEADSRMRVSLGLPAL